jgi:(2R)-ethylmalonyl-CoA mutase
MFDGRLRADAARPDVNLMDATLACARAGVTTGEWSFALREVFGEYRAPTGVGGAPVSPASGEDLAAVRLAVRATAAEIGAGRLRLLLGKPGMDGHSNGVEQIAVRARDAGLEVIFAGRLRARGVAAVFTPADFGITAIVGRIVDVIRRAHGLGPVLTMEG